MKSFSMTVVSLEAAVFYVCRMVIYQPPGLLARMKWWKGSELFPLWMVNYFWSSSSAAPQSLLSSSNTPVEGLATAPRETEWDWSEEITFKGSQPVGPAQLGVRPGLDSRWQALMSRLCLSPGLGSRPVPQYQPCLRSWRFAF